MRAIWHGRHWRHMLYNTLPRERTFLNCTFRFRSRHKTISIIIVQAHPGLGYLDVPWQWATRFTGSHRLTYLGTSLSIEWCWLFRACENRGRLSIGIVDGWLPNLTIEKYRSFFLTGPSTVALFSFIFFSFTANDPDNNHLPCIS